MVFFLKIKIVFILILQICNQDKKYPQNVWVRAGDRTSATAVRRGMETSDNTMDYPLYPASLPRGRLCDEIIMKKQQRCSDL